jgi:hypothetical protein
MSSPRVEEAINFVYSMGWSHDSGQDFWIVMVGDWTDWSVGGYQAYGHFWSSAANDNIYYAPIYMRPILAGAYGGGDQFDKTTAIIAHETAEAATDPMINGWYGDGGEVCDAGTRDTWVNNASGSGGLMVASYWLNSRYGPGNPSDLGWGQGTAPQPGLAYRLTPATNPSSGLDNTDWSTGWGTRTQIWFYTGGANQQWNLTADDSGYFTLHPLNAPWLSLDDSGASGDWGTPVDTWGDNGTAAQQWGFGAFGNGYYDLSPRAAPWDRLDVPFGSAADGTKLWLWGANGTNAQQWQLVRLGPRYLGMAPSAASAPGGGTDTAASATPVRQYAVSNPGGDLLAHVQVDTIFAGDAWAPGLLHDASARLDQASAHLVAGAYPDMPKEYQVSRDTFTGAWSNPTASRDAGTSTTGDVEAKVAAGIAGGQLSQPEADSAGAVVLGGEGLNVQEGITSHESAEAGIIFAPDRGVPGHGKGILDRG